MTQNICPVCGFDDLSEPAYRDGYNPSYEICPCCAYQFGYHDEAVLADDNETVGITFKQWRDKWFMAGMVWDRGSSLPPQDWDPKKQLENIGVFL
jgi:hypothetical protein